MSPKTKQLTQSYEKKTEEKIQDFTCLLDKIESLDDKKKQLWREIYENAITDRQNAYFMFSQLIAITQDKSTEHAVHGKSIATYIERMSRANDQLIKLAELVAKAEKANDVLDPEEMFDRIKNFKR